MDVRGSKPFQFRCSVLVSGSLSTYTFFLAGVQDGRMKEEGVHYWTQAVISTKIIVDLWSNNVIILLGKKDRISFFVTSENNLIGLVPFFNPFQSGSTQAQKMAAFFPLPQMST